MTTTTSHRLAASAIALSLLTLLLIAGRIPSATAQRSRQLRHEESQSTRSPERRLALVIGNGTYTNAPKLKNPPNDARDMAATLEGLGFEVTSGIDINQRQMKNLIRDFGQKLKGGGSGLFYYAGHGVQSKGRNYLIPIEADIQSEVEVEDAGVDVNLILGYMDDAQNGLNIVILDACRNNPFARSFRSATNGLAQVDAPTGTLIAYATAPGRVASDGTGQNGLYTSELLKQMRVPGLSVTDMFMRVRAEVIKQSGNKQVPWEASSLVGAFYFAGGTTANTSLTTDSGRISDSAKEQALWEAVKDSNDPRDLRDYIAKYPNGAYVAAANVKLRRMESANNSREPAQPPNSSGPVDTKRKQPNPEPTNRPSSAQSRLAFISSKALGVDPSRVETTGRSLEDFANRNGITLILDSDQSFGSAIISRVEAIDITNSFRAQPTGTISLPASKIGIVRTAEFSDGKRGLKQFNIALDRLNKEFEPLKNELDRLDQRLSTLTGAEKEQAQKDRDRKANEAQSRYDARRKEIFDPIRGALSEALDQFAKQNRITTILDVSDLQGIIYSIQSSDITDAFIGLRNDGILSLPVNVPDAHIATINSEVFFDAKRGLPRVVAAVKLLNDEFKPLQTELENMKERLERLSGSARDQLELEYKRKGSDAQAAYSKRRQEIFEPIQNHISQVLESFATQNGITLLIDTAQLPALMASNAIDQTSAFISYYNTRYPQ